MLAQMDWAMHLAASPGKLGALVDSAVHKWIELGRVATPEAHVAAGTRELDRERRAPGAAAEHGDGR